MPIDNLSTLARIQRMQHMTLVWIFAKAVSDYNEVLLKHQDRCRAIVRQQLMISKLRVLGGWKWHEGANQCMIGALECRLYPTQRLHRLSLLLAARRHILRMTFE